MAKLYRGIFGISNIGLNPTSALLFSAAITMALTSECLAQQDFVSSGAPTAEQILRFTHQLLDPHSEKRKDAYQWLIDLKPDALPSIAERLDELQKNRPKSGETIRILNAIRHAVGSRRADDNIDIAPGVLKFLSHERNSGALKVIEPLLLLRSLEKIGTRQAGLQIVHYFSLDQGAWLNELRRSRSRMGIRLLPVLIEMRGHESLPVRRWAKHGISALGMRDPAIAIALTDHHLVAQIIDAYSKPMDFKALPVIISAMSSDRVEVREAALRSIKRYKSNAKWKLREAFEEETGKPAPKSWTYRKLSEQLFAAYHRSLFKELDQTMEQGLAAFHKSAFKEAQKHFDSILSQHPKYSRRTEMAPTYAALGQFYLATDDLSQAERFYRYAVRLSPKAEAANDWRAQIAFIEAEKRLSRGIADLPAYQKALQLDPDHDAARAAVDRLGGAWERRYKTSKRWSRICAVILLSLFAFGLLYRRKKSTVSTT